MIIESKRIEFWNFLTAEKNQARPKGITSQRLAVIKPALISSDELWMTVIEQHGAGDRPAAEFYQSNAPAANHSRTAFWNGVRSLIRQDEVKTNKQNLPFSQGRKPRRTPILRNRRRQS
jgi:hypothetical protein